MKKKVKLIIVSFIVLIVTSALIFYNFTITFPIKNDCKIGIIDTDLSKKVLDNKINIIKSENITFKSNKPMHGDSMIEFITSLNNNVQLYYYNATNPENEIIDSQMIIKGLEWMKRQGVKCVNISLSGKIDSNELKTWLKENSSNLKVFSSYNNRISTFDYPAGYENVIGSGIDSRINWGKNDIRYHSNKIIILPSFKIYEGNSYLSLLSLMKEMR